MEIINNQMSTLSNRMTTFYLRSWGYLHLVEMCGGTATVVSSWLHITGAVWVAWNRGPWQEHLYHGNQQLLKIRVFSPKIQLSNISQNVTGWGPILFIGKSLPGDSESARVWEPPIRTCLSISSRLSPPTTNQSDFSLIHIQWSLLPFHSTSASCNLISPNESKFSIGK